MKLPISSIAAIIGLGLAAGAFSGLLGIGAGIIMVPALSALWGVAVPDAQKVAQGTALAVMVPMSIAGALRYHFGGELADLRLGLPLVIWGLALGAIALATPLLLSPWLATGQALAHVNWNYVVALALGGVIGTMWLGAPLANILPVEVLKRVFGVFMILVGLRMTGVFALIGGLFLHRAGG